MEAKENPVLLLFKCKHMERYIEYRKMFDNIEISIFFFIYRPALITNNNLFLNRAGISSGIF